MEISLASHVAGVCHQTFPHGVALLLYMLEHGIVGVSLLDGDFERVKVNGALLCSSMLNAQGFNEEVVSGMEETFQEIGRILRAEK